LAEPLIIDLDGTLIRNDLTHELVVLCARWKPWLLPLALFKLLTDRPAGKRWLVGLVGDRIDPAHLPYDPLVLDLIAQGRKDGRLIELVSGSDHLLVERVGQHLTVFDFVQGSDPARNLVSANKALFLVDRHPNGYLYAGNSSQDLNVWKTSKGGFGLSAPASAYQLRDASDAPVDIAEIRKRPSLVKPLLKTLRLHQWAKNILIFVVPGLLVAQLDWADWIRLVQGFVCFGLMASGTYILNDLFDIPDDRAHPTKSTRPLASGTLSVPVAIMATVGLIGGGLVWAFLLSEPFLVVLLMYAITTVFYSFRLKRLPLIDVFILASLFCLRVIAGAEMISAPPSSWLMTFIGLIFLSLALAKRYVEVSKSTKDGKIAGRGYVAQDAPLLLAFGAASSFSAIMALAVYGLLEENRVIQNSGVLITIAAILAAWSMRIWMMAVREELDDDPVLFAVKDHVSLICLVAVGCLILFEASRPLWSAQF
tara:strand:- start:444 stop:1886 length:1443 start_codon:yes stop_codon:yes gene_type:complete